MRRPSAGANAKDGGAGDFDTSAGSERLEKGDAGGRRKTARHYALAHVQRRHCVGDGDVTRQVGSVSE
jgi:hypothetical protein